MKHVFSMLFLFTTVHLFAQNGWYPVSPFPAANHTNAISCLDDNTAVTIGGLGTMLRTSDRGVTWLGIRASLDNLEGVAFLDASMGFAFGEGGIILKTTNGGIKWNGVTAPPTLAMLACSIFDKNNACIVGLGGTVLHTSDGGSTWQMKHKPTKLDLYTIVCLSPSVFLAGGLGGIYLRSVDSGSTWTQIPAFQDDTLDVRHLYFRDVLHGIASTRDKNILNPRNRNFESSDGGLSWIEISSGPLTAQDITFLKYFSATSGICAAGRVCTTSDGGAHWNAMGGSVGTHVSFSSLLSGFDEDNLALAGSSFRYTSDGGITWQARSKHFGVIPFPGVAFAPHTSVGVTFTDTINFWNPLNSFLASPTNSAGFYKTTDAGSTWNPLLTSPKSGVLCVAMPDPNHITGVGWNGNIVNSSDAGAHWTKQVSGTTVPLYGVAFGDALNGFAVGGNITIVADSTTPDPTDSVAKYYRIILQTTDGGITWTKNYDRVGYYLKSIAMLDRNNAIGVGINGTITKTTDGGKHWSEENLVGYPTLNSVSFVDSTHVTVVGNEWYIAHSRDGGTYWTLQHVKNQSGSIYLNSVAFADSANGTAVGTSGIILRTTNGGDTWNQQWSATLAELWGVAFTDVNTGVIVGG